MVDIRAWLEGLGLERYADAFEENGVDLTVLPDLTADDIKEIGVKRVGDRRKILNAIGQLTTAPADAAIADHTPGSAAQGPREAERRQLTVMFCDLVGSTALSEKLDPEDLRALMAAYRQAAGDVVARYDGHVAQYLGDGLMIYFGWPRAHEDDAERAVRAGLDIVAAIKQVGAQTPLHVRIGIATGQVVVGEGADDDAQANRLAIGETPNLASRLQGLAGPDQIVIGPGTYRLTGGRFEYADLGARNLKGILEPVRAWRVERASAAEGRFEAQATGGLTPFIGRESELQLLMDRWEQACQGEGQVALLSGEPGIGKSRISQVLQDRLADVPHVRLRYQCSPYYSNSAFYPIIDQIERAAGFVRDETPAAKLDKLEALFGSAPMALMAALLSLPVDRYPPLNLTPQRQKDDTITALVDQVIDLAAAQPVLILFEDAHWCDPTTLETLTAVVGRIEAAPVLMVITFRPEFDPPWTGHGHVVLQSLSRLGRRQGADMVEKVTGGKALPDEVLEQIVAKTDGVPLFVEELTKTVLEAGFLIDAGDRYVLDGPLPPLAVPATLQDSLTARLDRLSPVKEVAQIGACIGREFSFELLSAVAPVAANTLEDALQQLVNSELIFRRGTPPDATYVFKHALVQDSAYDSLLRGRRQLIHQDIAQVMENRFSGAVAAQPELLAHHLTEAASHDRAIEAWYRAGSHALDNHALNETIGHLERGLELLPKMTADLRPAMELKIRVMLGTAHMAAVGWGSAPVKDQFVPAWDLAVELDEKEAVAPVLWGLSVNALVRAEIQDSLHWVRELLAAGDNNGDRQMTLIGHMAGAMCEYWHGDFEASLAHAKSAQQIYVLAEDRGLASIYNHDPYVLSEFYESFDLLMLGYPSQGFAAAEAKIERARALGHPFDIGFALGANGFYTLLGEFTLAEQKISELVDIALDNRIDFFEQIYVPALVAYNEIAQHRTSASIDAFRQGFDRMISNNNRSSAPAILAILADAHSECGDHQKAHAYLAEARTTVDGTDERCHEVEVYRVHGDVAVRDPAVDDGVAEDWYRRAMAVADTQKNRFYGLRTATSLAAFWHSQGRATDAIALLEPVHDWFTEGFEFADWKKAKALLDTLKQTA